MTDGRLRYLENFFFAVQQMLPGSRKRPCGRCTLGSKLQAHYLHGCTILLILVYVFCAMFVVLPTKTKICIQSERNFKVDITKPGQKHFPAFSGDTDWMKVERCFTDDSLLSYLANRNEMQSLSPVYLSSFLNPWQIFFERVI